MLSSVNGQITLCHIELCLGTRLRPNNQAYERLNSSGSDHTSEGIPVLVFLKCLLSFQLGMFISKSAG